MKKTVLLLTLLIIVVSCNSVKHSKDNTEYHADKIKTEYCFELVDSKGRVKVHSHITGKVYLLDSVQLIYQVIESENL
jgi:cytochrome oxidase Cu insertion factor (SCO1/SenC/PrrC family)